MVGCRQATSDPRSRLGPLVLLGRAGSGTRPLPHPPTSRRQTVPAGCCPRQGSRVICTVAGLPGRLSAQNLCKPPLQPQLAHLSRHSTGSGGCSHVLGTPPASASTRRCARLAGVLGFHSARAAACSLRLLRTPFTHPHTHTPSVLNSNGLCAWLSSSTLARVEVRAICPHLDRRGGSALRQGRGFSRELATLGGGRTRRPERGERGGRRHNGRISAARRPGEPPLSARISRSWH